MDSWQMAYLQFRDWAGCQLPARQKQFNMLQSVAQGLRFGWFYGAYKVTENGLFKTGMSVVRSRHVIQIARSSKRSAKIWIRFSREQDVSCDKCGTEPADDYTIF